MRNECHRGGVGRTARTRRGGGDREWYYEEEGWRPHTYDVGVWGRNFLVYYSDLPTNIFSRKQIMRQLNLSTTVPCISSLDLSWRCGFSLIILANTVVWFPFSIVFVFPFLASHVL